MQQTLFLVLNSVDITKVHTNKAALDVAKQLFNL